MSALRYPTGYYCLEIGANGRPRWPVTLTESEMLVELAPPGPIELSLFGRRLPTAPDIWHGRDSRQSA